MTFKTEYSYTLPRGKLVSEVNSKPLGTRNEFQNKINTILDNFGNEPNFKLNASFG